MSPQTEHDFENRLRALYRRTADEVDTVAAARLRETRRRALEAAEKPRLFRWLMPMGAVAAGLLAVVVIWPSATRHPGPSRAGTSVSTADTSLPPDPEGADPAMYQDLDFYAWLADQPSATRNVHRGG